MLGSSPPRQVGVLAGQRFPPNANCLWTPAVSGEGSAVMTSWSVRSYRPGDEGGINDLFNAVFERRRPLDAWRWKFDRNPATREKVIAVAEDDGGRIVGVYAAMPMRFRIGDRTVVATQPVDNCIAPEYRGGGRVQVALYREYVRRMREIGAAFGFGFPNEIHYPIGKRLLKYVDLTSLMLLDRRLSFRLAIHRRTTSRLLRRAGEAIGEALIRLDLERHRLKVRGDLAIEQTGDFDEAVDDLWGEIETRVPVTPIRDRAYLRWRYVENPEGDFPILRATRDGRLAGYLVGKIRQEPSGARVGYILDAGARDEGSLVALLCRSLGDFHAARVDWVRCGLPSPRVRTGPFAAVGFRRCVGRMPGVYVIYDDSLDRRRFADASQWDLSLGDSDIFTDGS